VGRIWTTAALLLSALSSLTAGGQSPADRRRIWSLPITRILHEPPGWATIQRHEARAVAFTPDDKRLAVTLDHASHAHVLILDSAYPETHTDQFDLPDNCGAGLSWNPRGDALLVCGELLRLADRTTCSTLPPVPYLRFSSLFREFRTHNASWFDADHVVVQSGEILDLHCERIDRWPIEQGWQIVETAPSKHWLLLRHVEDSIRNIPVTCRYSVIDIQSHQPLPGWPTEKTACGVEHIAAGAETMCLMDGKRLHCMTVQGAREVPVPKKLRNYRLDQTSDSSARVIAERWEAYHDPWWTWFLFPLLLFGDDPGGPALPKEAVVVNPHTWEIVAFWKPNIQQDPRSPHVDDWPSHLAISGNGNLLAESGDGTLELFRLP
jgi:hypothetical protein